VYSESGPREKGKEKAIYQLQSESNFFHTKLKKGIKNSLFDKEKLSKHFNALAVIEASFRMKWEGLLGKKTRDL